ncbi:MAG: hypothetical protein DSZ29_05410, partial [Aquificaceae bacterium]
MKKKIFSVALSVSVVLTLSAPAQADEWDEMLEQLSISMPDVFDTDGINKKISKISKKCKKKSKSKKCQKEKAMTDAERLAEKKRIEKEEKELAEKKRIKKLTKRLYRAVRRSNIEAVKSLVLQHADTNYSKEEKVTLLHIAAAKGDFNIVRILATHGADVNAQTTKNWTPLHHAARFGHL